MKLYFFEGGILRSQKGFFTANAGTSSFDVPVPYFLIEHNDQYILFDSGLHKNVITDPVGHLSEPICQAYNPLMTEDNFVLTNLAKAGVKPEDISYVICSHLHFDHAGGIGLFPNAKYVVQRQELHYAYVPDPFMKNAYRRGDFDKDINWFFLEDWRDNPYDLLGDGKLIIYYTPGHSPGHQCLLVNLDNNAPMFFGVDACYTMENLKDSLLSGLACDNTTYLQSLQTIKELQSRGATIVTGHDPEAWKQFKVFPAFYD